MISNPKRNIKETDIQGIEELIKTPLRYSRSPRVLVSYHSFFDHAVIKSLASSDNLPYPGFSFASNIASKARISEFSALLCSADNNNNNRH